MEVNYNTVFYKIPVASLLLDKSGKIKTINKLGLELLEIDEGDCIGKSVNQLFKDTNDLIEYLKSDDLSTSGHLFYLKNRNNNKEIEIRISSLTDETDKSDNYVCTLSSFQTLINSSKFYNEIESGFESLQIGAIYTDKKLRVISANSMFCKISGISVDKLIGHNALKLAAKFLNKDAYSVIAKKISNYFEGNKSGKFDIKFNDKFLEIIPIGSKSSEHITLIVDATKRIKEKQRLEKLHSVAIQLASDLPWEKYFRIILQTAEQILDFDLASIILREKDELVLHMTTDSNTSTGKRMQVTKGIAGRTIRNQKSYVVNNVNKDKDAQPTNPEYQSTISVPIGNIGVFQVHSTKMNDFDLDDRDIVELLISHLKQSLIRSEVKEALEKNEQKYRSVFENTGAATIIIEEDMTLSLVNKKFEELVVEKRENIEYKKLFTEYIDRQDVERMRNYHIKRRVNKYIPNQYEFTLIDKNNVKKNIMCYVDMIEGTQKSVASYLEITNQKLTENELKSSLDEKKILLKEIHHRVKNNMQLISSLLNLHKHNVEAEGNDDIFDDIIGRINSIALIHEKLYKSDNYNEINIKSYIIEIVNDLRRSFLYKFNDVIIDVDVEDILINLTKAVPLGLVINEVVTNSMKHAFKGDFCGNPKLAISFNKDNTDLYVLKIIDNGLGFDNILVDKKLSFGLELVSILSRQLKGDSEYSMDNGTIFKLKIPMN